MYRLCSLRAFGLSGDTMARGQGGEEIHVCSFAFDKHCLNHMRFPFFFSFLLSFFFFTLFPGEVLRYGFFVVPWNNEDRQSVGMLHVTLKPECRGTEFDRRCVRLDILGVFRVKVSGE